MVLSWCIEKKKFFSRLSIFHFVYGLVATLTTYIICFQASIWSGSLSLRYVAFFFLVLAHLIAHCLLCEISFKSGSHGNEFLSRVWVQRASSKISFAYEKCGGHRSVLLKWERPRARLSEWHPPPSSPDQMQNAGCCVFSSMLVLYTMYILNDKCPVCK